jgi:hypothetical protein
MSKLLVSVDEARARLQISQEIEPTSLVGNIESAVSAAQHHVQSILETTFQDGTDSCVFFLDSESFSSVRPEGVFRLFLPTGLLKADSVTMLTGDKWNTCVTPVDPVNYEVDYEKGLVRVDESLMDAYVKVAYAYGVTPATTPAWLKEVILAFVPVMFHLSSTNSKGDPGVNMPELKGHANTVANGHLRKASFCLRPMR